MAPRHRHVRLPLAASPTTTRATAEFSVEGHELHCQFENMAPQHYRWNVLETPIRAVQHISTDDDGKLIGSEGLVVQKRAATGCRITRWGSQS